MRSVSVHCPATVLFSPSGVAQLEGITKKKYRSVRNRGVVTRSHVIVLSLLFFHLAGNLLLDDHWEKYPGNQRWSKCHVHALQQPTLYKDISRDINNPDVKKTLLIYSWASVSQNIQKHRSFYGQRSWYPREWCKNSTLSAMSAIPDATNWSLMVP